jgi:hypothetical protein
MFLAFSVLGLMLGIGGMVMVYMHANVWLVIGIFLMMFGNNISLTLWKKR